MQAASKQASPGGADSISDGHGNDGYLRPADRTLTGSRPRDRSADHPAQHCVPVREHQVEVSAQQLDLTAKLWFPLIVHARCPATLAVPRIRPPAVCRLPATACPASEFHVTGSRLAIDRAGGADEILVAGYSFGEQISGCRPDAEGEDACRGSCVVADFHRGRLLRNPQRRGSMMSESSLLASAGGLSKCI